MYTAWLLSITNSLNGKGKFKDLNMQHWEVGLQTNNFLPSEPNCLPFLKPQVALETGTVWRFSPIQYKTHPPFHCDICTNCKQTTFKENFIFDLNYLFLIELCTHLLAIGKMSASLKTIFSHPFLYEPPQKLLFQLWSYHFLFQLPCVECTKITE